MPDSPPQDRVVLFDMDGVLLHGDTMGSLLRRGLARRPWRLVPAVVLVAVWQLLPSAGPGRPRIDRVLVRLGLRGFDEQQYETLAGNTAVALASSAARNGDLIDEAARLRDQGVRVIVVTGSERRLARSYLEAAGLHRVDLLASELSITPRRRASFSSHNVGQQKVAAVERAGVNLSKCLLYTDSASDLPLIRRVAECVLVAPSRATSRAVQRADLPIRIRTI